MCTILTVSREFFLANKDAILNRIKADANLNGDGWSLIMCGKKSKNATHVTALDLEVVLANIQGIPTWERFWLHARLGTTKTTGIEGCHGFRSYKGYLVQHNGIISAGGALELPVDSMVIPKLLGMLSINDTVSWLHAYANYANVFFVNPDNGHWVVSRTSGGTLYTDGMGNYSSNVVGAICIKVGDKYFADYQEEVAKPVSKYFNHSYWDNYWDDDRYDGYTPSKSTTKHADVPEDVAVAVDEAEAENDEAVMVESGQQTLRNLKMQATMEGWTHIPYDVYKRLTKSERKEMLKFLKKLPREA